MGVRKTFGSDNHHSHYVVNSQFECTATALKKKKKVMQASDTRFLSVRRDNFVLGLLCPAYLNLSLLECRQKNLSFNQTQ